MKILHIGGCDKFLPPYIELVKENFDFSEHEFLLHSGMGKAPGYRNVKVYERKIIELMKFYFSTLIKMHRADKIILHGLFDIRLVFVLFFTPWVLKKSYWVMWGGDLYIYKLGERNASWKRREFFRRSVIKNMGHLVTYIPGDVQLARKWYGAKGIYHECIMYPSNQYKTYEIPAKRGKTKNILVGNSADPSNNHLESFEKLMPFKEQDIAIYCPLSYGDQKHALKVIEEGEKMFGVKFKPLTELIPFNEYYKLLTTIDIAIFNHERQQAMGSTITLLGLGKTVYIRRDTTQWLFFKEKKIIVRDVEDLGNLEVLCVSGNQEKIKRYFSKENFIGQLEGLFNGSSG